MPLNSSVIPLKGIEAFLAQPCPTCDGHRYIVTTQWARLCARCGWYAKMARFMPRSMRGDEMTFPDAVKVAEPYPLFDQTWIGVPWDVWRMMAWKSLAPFAFTQPELFWVRLEITALIDISFGRYHDQRFENLGDLHTPDLLVIHFPRVYRPYAALASYVQQVLSIRTDMGRPTWAYCELPLHRFVQVYGSDMALVLRVASEEYAAAQPAAGGSLPALTAAPERTGAPAPPTSPRAPLPRTRVYSPPEVLVAGVAAREKLSLVQKPVVSNKERKKGQRAGTA